MTFAEQSRAAREKAGLSPIAAAELLGVSSRTIYNWESGDPIPPIATQEGVLVIYARATDATPTEAAQ